MADLSHGSELLLSVLLLKNIILGIHVNAARLIRGLRFSKFLFFRGRKNLRFLSLKLQFLSQP